MSELNENNDKKNELIKILSKLNYTYDEPENDIFDKIYDLYKNNIIDHECVDGDYLTYKAYYYYQVLHDNINSKKFYKEAVEKGNTHGMHGLAIHYKKFDKYNKMSKYLKMAIKKNDSVAMIDYGNHHLFENNDINKAMKYYNMGKKNNHFRGYYELAYYFFEFKFNYQKCKENMILFLESYKEDKEVYMDNLKLRGAVLEKLITLILINEYENDIEFLKPYCEMFDININDTIQKYKIKIQSRKQFQINREKIKINDECGVCYENKDLYLFDCIGHYICTTCYLKVDKCPFCSISKHPLMMRNKNMKEDIPLNEITEVATSDNISDYESNDENSDDEIVGEEEEDDEGDDENGEVNTNIELIPTAEEMAQIEHHQDGGQIYTPPNETEE